MADLKEYENEYYGHVQTAHEKLALAEAPCTSSEAGRSACVATERALEAAKDVVQLMELEGRMLTGTARGKLQERLRVCRDELTSLKDQLKAARAAARSNKPQEAAKEERIREECFAGSDQHRDEGETSRMIFSNDRILRATARLNAAHSVTLDMENTANAILGGLSKQRGTLYHARGTLRFASDGLDRSRGLLNTMARRASMNKFTMYVVIALLFGMIVLRVWAGGSRDGGESAAAAIDSGAGWEKARKH